MKPRIDHPTTAMQSVLLNEARQRRPHNHDDKKIPVYPPMLASVLSAHIA